MRFYIRRKYDCTFQISNSNPLHQFPLNLTQDSLHALLELRFFPFRSRDSIPTYMSYISAFLSGPTGSPRSDNLVSAQDRS